MTRNVAFLITLAVLGLVASCIEPSQEPVAPTTSTPGPTLAQKIEHFRSGLNGAQAARAPLPGATEQPVLKNIAPRTIAADSATIAPPSLDLTLHPGECQTVTKTVYLSGTSISRADILFLIDRTGSMGDEIAQLQLVLQSVADQLALLIDDPAFGVASYMDYPSFYSYCNYGDTYGEPTLGDVPYVLNQPITADVNPSKVAVGALSLGNGWDGPESYARALYETYTDPAIGWRVNSRRIVVNVGDAVPHDCDIGACLGLALGSTGVDPGRDGVAGTGDDLAIQDVIAGMAANDIVLIHINSEGVGASLTQDLWSCWTAGTGPGGVSVQINADGTVPGGIDLAQLIFQRVGTIAASCPSISLVPTPGFEPWVQNLSPPSYNDVELPATLTFTLDLCVPAGTAPGTYAFSVCATCGGSPEVCEQDRITVPETSAGFFTGGGHLDAGGKVTFGFNAGYHDARLSGQMQVNDHAAKKRVHSTSVDAFSVSGDCCIFSGACRVNNIVGYTYEVSTCDHAEPGKDVDSFEITVWNAALEAVYHAGGILVGGNIQKHDDGLTRQPGAALGE